MPPQSRVLRENLKNLLIYLDFLISENDKLQLKRFIVCAKSFTSRTFIKELLITESYFVTKKPMHPQVEILKLLQSLLNLHASMQNSIFNNISFYRSLINYLLSSLINGLTLNFTITKSPHFYILNFFLSIVFFSFLIIEQTSIYSLQKSEN